MAIQERTHARRDGRFHLGRRWRKTTLIVHIVSAGAWIGIDVIVAVLVLTGRFGTSDDVRGLAYRALATFVVWPMLASALICLVTGVVLGLGTRWGLVRYWWVAVKLVLNLILCTLILVALQPGMDEVNEYGRTFSAGGPEPAFISNLFFPPAVSLTTLTFATVLAVTKPWGRIGRRSRRSSVEPPR
ncbi:hypothetical protein [Actinomadura bangladeshensis]|uniref:DUF2269 domain-containing protein n=1 Tax=Actinomadura bangladeshensis TaxID=453573 RepID=A0A4R4NYP8_9ACTN|nr:hypothetical protein [Actinomadura bangladeshensis]TDC13317.1 hypothetical protein E1284_20560 [Actinomadura bangladeshensis]